MNTEQTKTGSRQRRKILKTAILSVLSLLFLLLFAAGAIQTRVFKNQLKEFVIGSSRGLMKGELLIDRIDGNFFTHLVISGLLLKSGSDTVVYVPKFTACYSPSRLLSREVVLDTVRIDSPVLKLRQHTDGTWNINDLFDVDTVQTAEQRPSDQPPGLSYKMHDFFLNNARIEIAAADSVLPRLIRNMDLHLSAGYSTDDQELSLHNFRFESVQPDFQLREFSFLFLKRQNDIELSRFVLQTGKNTVFGEGHYNDSELSSSGLALDSEPLDLTELALFLPDIRLHGAPVFSLSSRLRGDSLRTELTITESQQRIFLQADVANFRDIIDGATDRPRYALLGSIDNVDVAGWTGDPDRDYVLSGDFSMQGTGTTAQNADIVLKAQLSDCLLNNRNLEKIIINSIYKQGFLTGDLSILGDMGRIEVTANVEDLGGENRFEVQAGVFHFDLADLFLDDSLSTDIGLKFSARGSGFDPEKYKGDIQLSVSPSTVIGVPIDTLAAGLSASAGVLSIDTLFLESPWAGIDVEGYAGLKTPIDIRFETRLKNLSLLGHLLNTDTLRAQGLFSGVVTGKPDSFTVDSDFSFADILFEKSSVETLKGEAFVDITRGTVAATARVGIDRFGSGDIAIDHIDLQTAYDPKRIDMSTEVAFSDSLTAKIRAFFVRDSLVSVGIPEIALEVKGRRWTGGGADTQIILDRDRFVIDNFELKSTGSETGDEQIIFADGVFSLNGREDLQVSVSGFDIGVIENFTGSPVETRGRLSLDLKVAGTADLPRVSGSLSLLDGQVDLFEFDHLGGRFDYNDKSLSCSFFLFPGYLDTLLIDGTVPLDLSFSDFRAVLNDRLPTVMRLRAAGLSLETLLSPVKQIEETTGTVQCDINLRYDREGPRADGFFRVVDSSFRIPELDIDYEEFDLSLSIAERRLSLDSLRARQNRGSFRASGYVVFDSTFMSGNISSTHIDITADKFYLSRHRDYEIQISGDTRIWGDGENPEFGGAIKILRSSFYLPAFSTQNTGVRKEKISDPMLVRISQPSLESAELSDEKVILTADKSAKKQHPFLSGLHGTVHVSIPRNTWLKSPEMKMEIAGELDLVKSGLDLEVFGSIDIVRGQYNLYGRRFKIVEGRFVFQGGRELNPEITLKTEYIFRTAAREKKSLELDVSGKALNPTMTFTLDGVEIDEGDAVSYIVFGRSQNGLTYGQQTGMAETGEGGSAQGLFAMGVVSNVLSKQLRETLGSEFDLDVIEINVQDNWQSAAFLVGKYLTNDLFMSYQREFGDREDDDVVPQTITLEYELTRVLFLQLIEGDTKTSGFDVIFKYER